MARHFGLSRRSRPARPFHTRFYVTDGDELRGCAKWFLIYCVCMGFLCGFIAAVAYVNGWRPW